MKQDSRPITALDKGLLLPVMAPRVDGVLATGAFVGALACYVILGVVAVSLFTVAPVDVSELLPSLHSAAAPEPRERFLYLLGLACIPVLPVAFYRVLIPRSEPSANRLAHLADNRWLRFWQDVCLLAGPLVWIAVLAYSADSVVYIWPLLWSPLTFVAVATLLWLAARRKNIEPATTSGGWPTAWFLSFSSLLSAAWILIATVPLCIDDRWYAGYWIDAAHLDVLLGAINQVRHGRTVLVDTTSQYGILYPQIADVLLWPWELTVASVSRFFAWTAALSSLGLYLALGQKIGFRGPWAGIAFAAVLGLHHPTLAAAIFHKQPGCLYFQYMPLRVVWGAFFIAYSGYALRRPSRRLRILGYLLAALSVLWNADTGLVVLIAWTGTHCLQLLAQRPLRAKRLLAGVLCQIGLAAASLILAVLGYALLARLRSGQFPDFHTAMTYQQVFYGTGLMMLPMRFWEFWQPVILIYVLTVFLSVRRVLAGQWTPDRGWYFFIAVYGLGIFSYYQGRSYFSNLTVVLYPAIVLCCFYCHDWLQAWRALAEERAAAEPAGQDAARRLKFWPPTLDQRRALLAALVCGLLPLVGLTSFCLGLPAAAIASLPGAVPFPCEPRHPEFPELENLLPELRPLVAGRPTVIVSLFSNYAHLQTGSYSALPFSHPGEIMLNRQLAAAAQSTDNPEVQYLLLSNAWFGVGFLEAFDLSGFELLRSTDHFRLLRRKTRSTATSRNFSTASPATLPPRNGVGSY